jgi:ribose 5-phosphate isomerase A
MTNSEKALELIAENMVVGLGSGRAASAFVRALGQRVHGGLNVKGVPSSEATAALAKECGIPLTTLADVKVLDIAVDGADEVDPRLDLIKGLGGALLREKIVAASARKVVILVGEEKLVPLLGSRGLLPLEIVPFGLSFCRDTLEAMGYPSEPRMKDGKLFVTDNGNHILDCKVAPMPDATWNERDLRSVPGVAATGLFLNMAHVVLIQHGDDVEIRERSPFPS